MGNMKEIGLLDCEDRPSIEENFKRVQGGGGGAILDSNGKLKSEVLPDGYPYMGVEEKNGNCPAMITPDDPPFVLEGFPAFDVGDTVKVKVDGVDYSLVALDGGGFPFIGDDPSVFFGGNAGEYGWIIAYADSEVCMNSYTSCIVSWETPTVVQMDGKFLPLGGFKAICIYEMNNEYYRCNMSFEEMWNWMEKNNPVLFPYVGIYHGQSQSKYSLLNKVFRRNGDNVRYIQLGFFSTDGKNTQTTIYYLDDGTITLTEPSDR